MISALDRVPVTDPRATRERDVVVDFLRVAAIALVVVGHAITAVALARRGSLASGRMVVLGPFEHVLTWAFQVMPVIFIVGGFANAGSWSRAAQRGETWASWVGRRARRLLRPTVPLVGIWVLFALLSSLLGFEPADVERASIAALIPLWFLATYLTVIACVPVTWAFHHRAGAWSVVAFVAAAATLDTLARLGVPNLELASTFVVWGGLHQIGYLWYEDRLPRSHASAIGLVLAGAAAVFFLLRLAGYPVSMIEVGAGEVTNSAPPTIALFALAAIELGTLLLARGAMEAALSWPRARRWVEGAGAYAIHVYLWHVTAFVLVLAIGYPFGLWRTIDRLTFLPWALILAATAIVVVLLVAAARRFEARRAAPTPVAPWRTLVGVALAVWGIAGISRVGVFDAATRVHVRWVEVGLLAIGLFALGAFGGARRPQENESTEKPERMA